MTKTNKNTKGHKNNKSKRHKGGESNNNYYNSIGSVDSVDESMKKVLGEFGFQNTSKSNQSGWAIGGIIGVGAVISILYFTLKK
jgi:hypothetical protein